LSTSALCFGGFATLIFQTSFLEKMNNQNFSAGQFHSQTKIFCQKIFHRTKKYFFRNQVLVFAKSIFDKVKTPTTKRK
jgi:hypothetical protein